MPHYNGDYYIQEERMYKLLLVTDPGRHRGSLFRLHSGLGQADVRPCRPPWIMRLMPSSCWTACGRRGHQPGQPEPGPLMRHLEKKHPFLPIYHPQNQLDALRDELRFRAGASGPPARGLSDDDYHVDMAVELLRDDLMRRLLLREVGSQQELKSRLSLCRAHFAADRHCFLSELHMPSGDQYLHSRWRYRAGRLEMALRANFLGRFVDNIYYRTALLDPGHLRIIACQWKTRRKATWMP